MAEKLAVRCLNGMWQVLLNDPEEWRDCQDEHAAIAIASGLQLARDVRADSKSGAAVVKQLEDAARAVRNNIGLGTLAESLLNSAARQAEGEGS